MTTTPESLSTRRVFVGFAGALAIGRFAPRHPLPNTGIIKTGLRDSRWFCPGSASSRFDE